MILATNHAPLSPAPAALLLLPSLKSCTSLRELRQLHAAAIKTGRFAGDLLVAAEVLRCVALCSDRDLDYARKVFDSMPERNAFSYNTIIRGFAESEHRSGDALAVFSAMLSGGAVSPNEHTFPSVLKACAVAGDAGAGKAVHGIVLKLGFGLGGFVLTNLAMMYSRCGLMEETERLVSGSSVSPASEAGVILRNALVDGYFRLGMVGRALAAFDATEEKSVVSWNAAVAQLARLGRDKDAADTFSAMLSRGLRPNRSSLVGVLPAIARLGALDVGEWIHDYARRSGVPVDDVLGSALIDMYAKCGDIDKAVELFDELPQRSPITWNALIAGLALHGRATEALRYFSSMVESDVAPTGAAFIAVLNACSHAGLVDEGREFFHSMVKDYKMSPGLKHYTCFIDMLGRAGFVDEAEELLANMPMEPDDVIYKSLLAACRLHRRADMAARIADRLLALAPSDEGSYVLLSNLYASSVDWDKVADVRRQMKERSIRKEAGRSWTTVDGATHEFVVEDDSHPRKEEIYKKLEEMAARLRAAGHIPDTTQVLLNISETEKERALLLHSEKIAVAFGLISTAEGSALRVMKNLRVCDDCHSAMKLVSRVYGRRIVLRDRSRFHSFEGGSCSCGDYW